MTKQTPVETPVHVSTTSAPFAGTVLTYSPEGTSEKYEIDAGKLPAASLAHLLQAGFSKVVGGAASNTKTTVEKEMAESHLGKAPGGKGKEAEKAEWEAKAKAYVSEHKEAVAEAVTVQAAKDRQEQFQALQDGTISTRGPSDPLAPFMRTVLENAVRKHCQKTGQTIPTGAALTAACKEVLTKHGETKVRERAEALMAASEL